MNRKSGHYLIRSHDNRNDEGTENGWEVAYYDQKTEHWFTTWDGGAYVDGELTEIDETLLKPK